MQNVNLIPKDRIEARRRRRRMRQWAWGCGLYAAALLLACGVVTAMGGRADRMTVEELARLSRQITETGRQVALVHPELVDAKAQLDASRAVTIQPDWGVLLKLMGVSRGEKVVLDRITLAPVAVREEKAKAGAKPAAAARGNIALAGQKKDAKAKAEEPRKPLKVRMECSGLAQSQLDVSEFVLRLEQMRLFDQVKLLDTNRGSVGSMPAVSFHVECWMSEEPAGGHKP